MNEMYIHPAKDGKPFYLAYKADFTSEVEDQKLNFVLNLIKTKYHFETEANMLGLGLPPYVRFKEQAGIEVSVVLDDYFGLTIASNSEDFLKKIKPELECS